MRRTDVGRVFLPAKADGHSLIMEKILIYKIHLHDTIRITKMYGENIVSYATVHSFTIHCGLLQWIFFQFGHQSFFSPRFNPFVVKLMANWL